MIKRLTEEHKAKISVALKGKPKSLEARLNMSRADKGRPAWNKGKKMSEEFGAICRATHGGHIPWNKGLTKETDGRVAHYAETNTGMPNTAEQVEASRQAMLQKWQDASFVTKQMRARGVMPNKIEHTLIAIMERNNLPFKYVGDGDFILDGKCPDFLNINGKKQLIELFGTFWHGVFDVAARKEHLRQYGFQTLIIWEDELKVLPEADIVKRIRKFSLRKEAKK